MKKKTKRKVFTRKMRRRFLLFMILFSAAMAVIVGKLIYINRVEGEEFEQVVLYQKQYLNKEVPFKRGDIRDCNGTVLATSNRVYNLILEPDNINLYPANRELTINALVKYFRFSREEIEEELKHTGYYRMFKKGLTYPEIKPFQEYCDTDEGKKVMGVQLEEDYVRDYPYGELACHMVGFSNASNDGLAGLEYTYNDELNGSNGRKYSYLDEDYNVVSSVEPAIDGYNIVTSLDAEIQRIVQKNASELQKELNAKNISVLVMQPKTCEVLALYNTHQYDLNDPFDLDRIRYQYPDMTDEEFAKYKTTISGEEESNALNTLWRNFAISDTFEPGSTFKTFVLAGALEYGVVSEEDTFYCDGHQQVADWDIYCSKHDGHGTQDLGTAMANSCNDAFMQIGALMGRSVFYRNQSTFGFGQKTNIDIAGEMDNESLASLVFDEERLNETELATSAFGQSVSVSMIQLGTAFCSAINGGYYYQPHVVRRVEDSEGNLITNYENILVRRTVSEQTSAELREMLRGVVNDGTGWRTQMEGYTIGGKTGTAEKHGRNEGKFLLSFIGFAPVEDPSVVIYCVVDEPDVAQQDRSSGATVLFSMISKDLFPYLNIYRTGDGEVDTKGQDEELSPVFVEGSPTDEDRAGTGDNGGDAGNAGTGDNGGDAGDPEGGDDAGNAGDGEE